MPKKQLQSKRPKPSKLQTRLPRTYGMGCTLCKRHWCVHKQQHNVFCHSARQRRQQQDKLRAVKTLGEADDDEGDVMAWVAKSRTLEDKAKAEARAKAAELERKLAEQEEEEQEADPASLAGLKIKGAVEDLMEGEALVMTLEDAPILTDRMELHEGEDVLVNVAKVCKWRIILRVGRSRAVSSAADCTCCILLTA